MTDTTTMPAISDAVHALLALLTPAEQASLAGSILHTVGINDDTVRAFANELCEDELAELGDQIA